MKFQSLLLLAGLVAGRRLHPDDPLFKVALQDGYQHPSQYRAQEKLVPDQGVKATTNHTYLNPKSQSKYSHARQGSGYATDVLTGRTRIRRCRKSHPGGGLRRWETLRRTPPVLKKHAQEQHPFFWFFPSSNPEYKEKKEIVIWLNGDVGVLHLSPWNYC